MEELQTVNMEVIQLHLQSEIGVDLLEQVIERTGNFREGYYALKQIRSLYNVAMSVFGGKRAAAESEEELLEATREFLQSMQNIKATIQTHVDRIDS